MRVSLSSHYCLEIVSLLYEALYEAAKCYVMYRGRVTYIVGVRHICKSNTFGAPGQCLIPGSWLLVALDCGH